MLSSNSKIFNDIKQSYTGGSVDMFIPTNQSNEFVYGYDVNSLYPYEMMTKSFPTGNPIYFEGDIRKYDSKAFGFFFCRVITSNHLYHPIIQNHVKTKKGIRTISGLNSIKGFRIMLFIEELYNAEKIRISISNRMRIYI